jgi:hypothetical protein
MRKILLILILLFIVLSRFLFISSIPVLSIGTNITWRYGNIIFSLVNTVLIYLYVRKRSKNIKIALISSWVYSVLFWSFEQGRIVSQVNSTLIFLLMFLYKITESGLKTKIKMTVIFICLLPIIFPQLWIFRKPIPNLTFDSIKNLFSIISFDQLFFKNIYFWWGGVRDFGIINLAYLPFFVVGVCKIIFRKEFQIIFGSLVIILLTMVSPFYPETKELYLAVPFISYVIATGLYFIFKQKNNYWKIVLIFSTLFFIYELSGYYHFYFIHYSQEVTNNISRIHESF